MAKSDTQIKEEFLADRANSEIDVVRDDGTSRFIKIRNKSEVGHQQNWYDIITWPGALTINGEHGTWVFSQDNDFNQTPNHRLYINAMHWERRIIARDLHCNVMEFDADAGCDIYTEGYLYNLYSIVWAIEQFNAMREETSRRVLRALTGITAAHV